MKYLGVIVVLSFLFFGCSVFQSGTTHETKSDSLKILSDVDVELNQEQSRRLDYYFYEGMRYKAIGEPQKSFMYFNEALKIDSTCAACSYEVARLLGGNQEYNRALTFIESAYQYEPENKHYIKFLSRVYLQNDSTDRALHVVNKILELKDITVDDLYFAARLQIDHGSYKKGIHILDRIENRIGINEGLSLEKYQVLLKNEAYDEAEEELKKLIEQYPQHGDYYVYLGDFYFEKGNKKKALSTYEKCREIDPDNGKVLFSLANYFMQEGDNEKFKEYLFQAFSSDEIDIQSKMQRFMPFVANKGKNDNPLTNEDIIRIFDNLIQKHPDEARIYGAYGNFLVEENMEDDALRLFDQALELDARKEDLWKEYLFLLSSVNNNDLLYEKSSEAITFFPNQPLFRLFQGVSLFQKDQLNAAAKTMEKGLSDVEDNQGLKGRLHSYLGDVYHSLDSIDKCFNHYEKALEIDQNNVIVLNNYSYYLAVRNQDLDKAERMSSKTVEMNPGNPTYLDTYAWVLFKKGDYSQAQFIIERAIDNMDEPSGVILEHYGDILFKNGKVDQALEQWKEALKYEDHSDLLQEKINQKTYIDE